jgi:cyclic pyranopterin phosphate synthase
MSNVVPLPAAAPRDLLHRPMHDLRISVMDRCNFRCPYCMPRETFHEHYQFLRPTERLSFEEITRLAHLFVEMGVSKLRLTGGEPLLRPNLTELIAELGAINGVQDVALTTNGVLLEKYATELKASGLNRITVSLDSLDPAIFTQLSGGFDSLDKVLAGVRAAQQVGMTPIKINAVVQRGVNDHTLLDMLEHFRGSGVIVRFIEYMDVGNRNHWQMQRVVPSRELLARVHARWPVHAVPGNYQGEVAERYAYDDGAGELGFISSVTQAFCGSCTRARLSSEGVLYTCLFATQGLDLKTPLRSGASDDELRGLIRNVWEKRSDRYSEQRANLSPNEQPLRKIEMYYIGG